MVRAVQEVPRTGDPGLRGWTPLPGSQFVFLRCPYFEALLEGTRGGGKTDALLMDFLQFVGRGYGPAWRGILFRETYPNLEDVLAKTEKWFRIIYPDAVFNAGKYFWRFRGGERLYLRHAAKPRDYWKYHGHEYPWIGWEELTNWADDELYLSMMSICRSSDPRVPRRYRATCNPYGIGHGWVKARLIDPMPRGVPYRDGSSGRCRVAIHSELSENPYIVKNDPEYVQSLMQLDGPKREAWLHGNWDIVAGGMFDDVWDPSVHVVKPFVVPGSWYVDRSFDWGSSRPYSVGWWAESDGSDVELPGGRTMPTRPGDLFRIAELYGWTGKPNQGTRELAVEVARKIQAIEMHLELAVNPGPADASIYTEQDGECIATNMERVGVGWVHRSFGSKSRENGWEIMRTMLKNARGTEGPRLFVFETCRQFIRTVPVLPRDEVKMDDVDTTAEDHIADEARYRILSHKVVSSITQF